MDTAPLSSRGKAAFAASCELKKERVESSAFGFVFVSDHVWAHDSDEALISGGDD